jgi:hypothetical protein
MPEPGLLHLGRVRRRGPVHRLRLSRNDGTIEIEFAYHLGDEAILKAERMTSSTAC